MNHKENQHPLWRGWYEVRVHVLPAVPWWSLFLRNRVETLL